MPTLPAPLPILFPLPPLLLLRWTLVGQAGFSPGNANDLRLALNAAGTPHLAFIQPTNGGRAEVWRFDGSSWVPLGGPVAGSPRPEVFEVALAFAAGAPVLAVTEINGFNLTVVKYTGSSWSVLGRTGLTPAQDTATQVDLATTPAGATYISFLSYVQPAGLKASVMKYTGGSTGSGWSYVGAPTFTPGDASVLSMAVSAAGVPFVAFKENRKISVMKFAGNAWGLVGGAGFATSDGYQLSLALSAGGVAHVAFGDADQGSKLTVMKFTGGAGSGWSSVGSAGFTPGEAVNIRLALAGASATPYVCFADLKSGGKANVMRNTGSGWTYVGKPNFSEKWSYLMDLALTAGGVPYVAFCDMAAAYKATVMKFV